MAAYVLGWGAKQPFWCCQTAPFAERRVTKAYAVAGNVTSGVTADQRMAPAARECILLSVTNQLKAGLQPVERGSPAAGLVSFTNNCFCPVMSLVDAIVAAAEQKSLDRSLGALHDRC